MNGRDDLPDRQVRNRGQGMRAQIERGGAAPGFLECDILHGVLDDLADPRTSVDMRDDLQQEVRRGERGEHPLFVHREVFEAHRTGCDLDRAVVQRAHQGVAIDIERRLGIFLRKTP